MEILNARKIAQITRRMAIQIWENNWGSESIVLAGINNNGLHFANMLYEQMQAVHPSAVSLAQLSINPADPLSNPIKISLSDEEISGSTIVIVDDVANTGRTIFYACKALLDTLPSKVEVAVMVDRQHKSYPIRVDYMGLSLATTLKQNIRVQLKDVAQPTVFLE